MSLRVWLPLNGDLHNQGLTLLPDTSVNTFTYDAGKIGQCATGRVAWHLNEEILGNTWSVAMWVKPESLGTANNILFCKNGTSATDCHIYFSIISTTKLNLGVNGPSSSVTATGQTFTTGTWYHVAATYDGTTATIYLNGRELKHDTVTTAYPTGRLNMNINGRSTNAANTSTTGHITCSFNDFRLYDHCLSAAEVHEIAQGLILHYKLDGGVTTAKNLIKNGYGELGTTNWNSSTNFSLEVPPDHPEIKKSVYSNMTTEYIPIENTHSYKLEVYLKNSATSGNTYPSLYPYDIDKNFIYHYNCPDGFNLSTMTFLTQELKSGDTKIYVDDLSTWNANSGTSYNYAAIFNYSDSTEYIYPDGTYTRDTPAFGSGTTAKTNLDKTNNIITLNSAYSGPTKPVGTAVCAAKAGSTYYYPFGSLTKSSLNDWTYKTVTMTLDNIARLKYAKYIRYSTYDGTLHAGIKLIDLADDIDSTLVSDSSGYGHNGETINEVTISSDTPRYDSSIQLNGSNAAIKISDNKWMAQGAEAMTINLWAKSTTWAGARLFSCTQSGGFNTESGNSGYLRFPVYVYTDAEKTSATYKYDSKEIQISELSTTDWNMLTFVYDSTGTRTYINGELHHTYTNASYGIHFNTDARLFLGCEANTASPASPYFNGQISDFRIYCTPLLDTDIKQLYNMSMKVDKSSSVHTEELIEASSNIWTRENLLKYRKSGNSAQEIFYKNGKSYIKTWPAQYHQNITIDGAASSCVLYHEFQPNTQYVFDMWIDSSESTSLGGFNIFYTDGTSSDALQITANGNDEWVHKQYISDSGKTILRMAQRYGTNTPICTSLDSYIGPLDTCQIEKTAQVKATTFSEDSSTTKILKSGYLRSSQFIER